MSEEFKTSAWVENILSSENKSERTAKGWLKDIEKIGLIKNKAHGEWIKTDLQFVEDIIEDVE